MKRLTRVRRVPLAGEAFDFDALLRGRVVSGEVAPLDRAEGCPRGATWQKARPGTELGSVPGKL